MSTDHQSETSIPYFSDSSDEDFDPVEYKRSRQLQTPRIYICKYCDQRCSGIPKLASHIRWHHGSVRVKTETEIYDSSEDVNRFPACSKLQNQNTNEDFQGRECMFCGNMFRNSEKLENHMAIHTKEKVFQCPKCKISFMFSKTLRNHILGHSKHDYRCKDCKRSFIKTKHIRDHVKNAHSNGEMFSETAANAYSDNRETWKLNHDADTRKQSAVPPRSAQSSTLEIKISASQQLVNPNIKIPQSATEIMPMRKPFSCPYCPKLWITKAALRNHLPVHTNVRAFKCQIFYLAFKWKYQVTRHSKRPHLYKCKKCDFKFSYKPHLRKHSAVHRASNQAVTVSNNLIQPEPSIPILQHYAETDDVVNKPR